MVVIGETRGVRPFFYSQEDESGEPPRGMEKGLEEILFLPFYFKTIPLELSPHLDQSVRLFSLPVDAVPVYPEEDPEVGGNDQEKYKLNLSWVTLTIEEMMIIS